MSEAPRVARSRAAPAAAPPSATDYSRALPWARVHARKATPHARLHRQAQEAAQLLQAPWHGNVRQLTNLAERAVLQSRRGEGTIASLLMSDAEEATSVVTTEGKPLKEYVEAFEKMLIENTMRRHKGSIGKVMEELCLPRRTLNEKMAKYSLQRADYV